MAIVTEYSWESDTFETPETRHAFRDILATVAEKAREKLPQAINGRLDDAVRLVLAQDVMPQDDGTILVGSCSDPMRTYRLEGTSCDCKDFTSGKAPEGWCGHRIAAGLHKRVHQLIPTVRTLPPRQAPPEEEISMTDHEPIALVQDDWPPEEDLAEAGPPLTPPADEGLPEEPEEPAPSGLVVTQDHIERSPHIGLLMGALARAQGRMQNPAFDATNPHFHNRYASLAGVRDAVVPPCSAEGIAVTQLPTVPEPGLVRVTTGLWHASGQYLCSTLSMPVPRDKQTPQGYGTAITYGRRYALQAILNVAGDEDDDAESLRPADTTPRQGQRRQ